MYFRSLELHVDGERKGKGRHLQVIRTCTYGNRKLVEAHLVLHWEWLRSLQLGGLGLRGHLCIRGEVDE